MMIRGVPALLELAVSVFNAELLRQHLRNDGTVSHAEFKIGDSVVMVSEATTDFPPNPCWLHVYVEDVDATFNAAVLAGCTAIQTPQLKEGDIDRRGGVEDPFGICWWISTQVESFAS